MSYDDDHIAMAAEYVLGTLEGDERAQVETMIAVDPEFKTLVEVWERHLGELHAMVNAVEPPEEVWTKIRTAVTAIAPDTSMRLPEISAPQIAPVIPVVQDLSPAAKITPVVATDARRWKRLAGLSTALAACMAAFIAVQAFKPDMLPERMRPQGKTEVVQAPQQAQFVAVLQRDGGSPAFVMTIDLATKSYTVRKAGSDAPAGRSYELWMVSDRFPQPRSLGVIGTTDFTTRPALTSMDNATIHSAIYAVTVEPEGGSPSGAPTSAPIFAGKLLETVPAASTPAPDSKSR